MNESQTIDEIINNLKSQLQTNNQKLSTLATDILDLYHKNRSILQQLDSVIELSNINTAMYADEVTRLKDEIITLSSENPHLRNQDTGTPMINDNDNEYISLKETLDELFQNNIITKEVYSSLIQYLENNNTAPIYTVIAKHLTIDAGNIHPDDKSIIDNNT